MVAIELVAVGRDDECRGSLDTAAEHAQDVERRLVGPVDVLEHDDGRPVELVGKRERDVSCGRRPLATRAANAPVVWPARSRNGPSGAGVVRASQAPCRIGASAPLAERAHERRLADARLAADEHEASARGERLVELRELRLAFEELAHVLILRHPGAAFKPYLVCGKPRSTLLVAGSGQRLVTTLPRV